LPARCGLSFRFLIADAERSREHADAVRIDDKERPEPFFKLTIIEQRILTVIENQQPAIAVTRSQHGMIHAHGVVVQYHHTQVGGTEPGQAKDDVFGNRIILAVAQAGIQRTLLIAAEWCRPSVGRAPLLFIGSVSNRRIDPHIGNFDLGATLLGFGILDDVSEQPLCKRRRSRDIASVAATGPECQT